MNLAEIKNIIKYKYSIEVYNQPAIEIDGSFDVNKEDGIEEASLTILSCSENCENDHILTLLHELAHYLDYKMHGFTAYKTLTQMEPYYYELRAWRIAKRLARVFEVDFDLDFVQECLDTYTKEVA